MAARDPLPSSRRVASRSPLWREATFSHRVRTCSRGAGESFKDDIHTPDDYFSLPATTKELARSFPPLFGGCIRTSNSAFVGKRRTFPNREESFVTSSSPIPQQQREHKEVSEDKEFEIQVRNLIEMSSSGFCRKNYRRRTSGDDGSTAGGIIDRYQGERTEKLIRHGLGRYKYSNKFYTYEGEWSNGLKHGRGKLTMRDGSFYEGMFFNGEIHGRGVKVWENGGRKFVGSFKRGAMHGEGKLIYANGDYYHGGFKTNLKHGYGESKDDMGYYRGMFENGMKQGQGMFLYGDKASYVGGWLKNVPHGQGSFKNTDGFIISGEFRDGVPCVWPTRIKIKDTGPLKVLKGEHFSVSFQYVDDNGNPVECCQGFFASISCWFQKPKMPKAGKKSANLPDAPTVTDSLETIVTPFFPAVPYPMCLFKHFVESLHYPYSVVESENLLSPADYLRHAFIILKELVQELEQSQATDSEHLKQRGLKLSPEMDRESAHWPLPQIQPVAVPELGAAQFCDLALPSADRPGEPYEPFLIEDYIKDVEKCKRKLGVYFGERPSNTKFDALGRMYKDDSEEESEVEMSQYPGLKMEDLELPIEDQLKLILFHGSARKGNYCVRVEDTTPEAVFQWFSLERPEPDFIQIKVVERKQRTKKSGKSPARNDKKSNVDRPINLAVSAASDASIVNASV